jgi:hypothetical protein
MEGGRRRCEVLAEEYSINHIICFALFGERIEWGERGHRRMTTNDSIPDDGPGADVPFLFSRYGGSSKGSMCFPQNGDSSWKAEGEIFLTFNKGLSTYDPLCYGKYL